MLASVLGSHCYVSVSKACHLVCVVEEQGKKRGEYLQFNNYSFKCGIIEYHGH